MSLLLMEHSSEFQELTKEIYSLQLTQNSRLDQTLSQQAKKKMYEDVEYNVAFLQTTFLLEEDEIFARHAVWLYQLLLGVMTGFTREELCLNMTDHYNFIRSCAKKVLPSQMQPRLHRILDLAIEATARECRQSTQTEPKPVKYEGEIQRYLKNLLESNTKEAISLMAQYIKAGIPLEDVCTDIVSQTMYRVGELWHRHQLSIDMEHYCTSVTQMALSQFYPLIFSQPRKGKNVVVACVGSELHEMGARMVADLFEYNGWDSIYLGAAVPVESMKSAVSQFHPDLVTLSVTMPHHLPQCKEAVRSLLDNWPKLKIAVGGHAFEETQIWKSWGPIVCKQDARALVKWADENI